MNAAALGGPIFTIWGRTGAIEAALGIEEYSGVGVASFCIEERVDVGGGGDGDVDVASTSFKSSAGDGSTSSDAGDFCNARFPAGNSVFSFWSPPYKAEILKLLLTCKWHIDLPQPLSFDPPAQVGISFVLLRHDAISVFFLVFFKAFEHVAPSILLDVPLKANTFE
eukprot:CAMPEP_0195310582 /NCGR_PEP_ID=MMETSP0708-20121125/139_1 /TAXON_ID=33640 /ORGANISM="Asterionellopsis glacialis, Strain CCMP134" /LENGTH=166 /DNA_ID=CAMNT_0040374919 /DNA_START=772 /DNA_END=1268 /DNA_ORIENTATION=+